MLPTKETTSIFSTPTSSQVNLVIIAVGLIGLILGILTGIQPKLLLLGLTAPLVVIYFLADFERAVIGLLILRSSLDVWSEQGLPAAYAIGIDALTLLYVLIQLLTGRSIQTDWFWWCFAGWVTLQGLWVILLPLGGLGFDASLLNASFREWVRLFTLVMVYLLVMQLKGKIHPSRMINLLLISLIPPVLVGLLQIFAPSILPDALMNISGKGGEAAELAAQGIDISRIKGTLGHPNSFAYYLFLFIGLTWWKFDQSKQRWYWLLLLVLLAFLLVATKALGALVMLAVFLLVLFAPKIDLLRLSGGLVSFAIVIALFGSTEFGQARLQEFTHTPLLNPDMGISRAILIGGNSFNWRLAQWTELLHSWQDYPVLGFGLGLSKALSSNGLAPHNDYVLALVEGGLIGLLILLIFLGLIITRLFQLLNISKRNNHNQYSLCTVLLAISIAICVGMFSSNILSATPFFIYFWTIFAIAGWGWNEEKDSSSSDTLLRSSL